MRRTPCHTIACLVSALASATGNTLQPRLRAIIRPYLEGRSLLQSTPSGMAWLSLFGTVMARLARPRTREDIVGTGSPLSDPAKESPVDEILDIARRRSLGGAESLLVFCIANAASLLEEERGAHLAVVQPLRCEQLGGIPALAKDDLEAAAFLDEIRLR